MKIEKPSSVLEECFIISSSGKESSTGLAIALSDPSPTVLAKLVQTHAPAWQVQGLLEKPRDVLMINGGQGPVYILQRRKPKGPFSHQGLLEESDYAWFRDQGGALWALIRNAGVSFELDLSQLSKEQLRGLLVGIEMAGYQFKAEVFGKEKGQRPNVRLKAGKNSKDLAAELEMAKVIGGAVNWARHLVNMPPNALNPTSVAELATSTFAKMPGLDVEIWDSKRLQKEKMGLILGVGAGSPNPPCLVHLKYRPKKKSKLRPIALVGKGVTFDTGGLDIKPSAGMRLMKKDMGGSAAVLALASWVSESAYPAPVDFYLAMAENSVDGKSFRPSDVLISRSGQSVEIHNTDAEGRLVLGDALDVAVTAKDEPEAVINLATLTGAIKTALGTEISGLFSNHDKLADQLQKCGQKVGELNWRMPLYSRYTGSFSTPFADMVNAVDGWAGAITAALFLEKFVRQKPWAHLDIYGWNDKPTGALGFAGGNGQAVQTLIHFLEERL